MNKILFDELVKSQNPPLFVIPANAGIHHQPFPESRRLAYPESRRLAYLDPRLRGGDGFGAFYETVII
jgi:hypothetical protein